MSHPLEVILDHPVEDAGIRYERLVIANFGALAKYECHNVHRVVRSLATIYGVPRRVMRKLSPSDAVRVGAMVLALRGDHGPE
jgi:hypothetical protein